jgi:predicted Fe-S protein YdhL (DUF1289 family)
LSDHQLTLTAMIDQGEFFDIPSPCRRICELNNRGYCKGCFRSRDERLYWNQFTTFQKQLVVNLCEKRRLKVLSAKQQTAVVEEDDSAIPQLDLFAAATAKPVPEPETEPQPDSARQEKPELPSVIGINTETAVIAERDSPSEPIPTAEPQNRQAASAAEPTSGETSSLFAAETAEQSAEVNKDKEEQAPAKERTKSSTKARKADDSQLDMFR